MFAKIQAAGLNQCKNSAHWTKRLATVSLRCQCPSSWRMTSRSSSFDRDSPNDDGIIKYGRNSPPIAGPTAASVRNTKMRVLILSISAHSATAARYCDFTGATTWLRRRRNRYHLAALMANRVATPNNPTLMMNEEALQKRTCPLFDEIDGAVAEFSSEYNPGIPVPVERGETLGPSCADDSGWLATITGLHATGIETGTSNARATMIQLTKKTCCGTRPLIAHRRMTNMSIKQPIRQDWAANVENATTSRFIFPPS